MLSPPIRFFTFITSLYANFIIDEIGAKTENNGEKWMGNGIFFF